LVNQQFSGAGTFDFRRHSDAWHVSGHFFDDICRSGASQADTSFGRHRQEDRNAGAIDDGGQVVSIVYITLLVMNKPGPPDASPQL
jgi:hypothetical protein